MPPGPFKPTMNLLHKIGTLIYGEPDPNSGNAIFFKFLAGNINPSWPQIIDGLCHRTDESLENAAMADTTEDLLHLCQNLDLIFQTCHSFISLKGGRTQEHFQVIVNYANDRLRSINIAYTWSAPIHSLLFTRTNSPEARALLL